MELPCTFRMEHSPWFSPANDKINYAAPKKKLILKNVWVWTVNNYNAEIEKVKSQHNKNPVLQITNKDQKVMEHTIPKADHRITQNMWYTFWVTQFKIWWKLEQEVLKINYSPNLPNLRLCLNFFEKVKLNFISHKNFCIHDHTNL